MTVARQAGLWGRRIIAMQRGEVSAETLEAYRRAGGAVYDLLRSAESYRLSNEITGESYADATPARQAEFLCTWNAFALQTLGDQLLAAEHAANRLTPGYVPQVTARHVLAFYVEVEQWLTRARQAVTNPAYRLDVPVPSTLPPWVDGPATKPHLEGLRSGARILRGHVAVAGLDGPPVIQQLLTAANTSLEYAEDLWVHSPSPELQLRLRGHLRDAVERYYLLGQLLAVPELAADPEVAVRSLRPRPRRLPLPGEPGFDPWCLTDPATRDRWRFNAAARAAIDALWQADPDPARTLAIQSEIDAALASGHVELAAIEPGVASGHYYRCPWPAIYTVRQAVVIGDRYLHAHEHFTFDVGLYGGFRRELLVKQFRRTARVGY